MSDAKLERMNGKPINIEYERKWYKRILDLHGIEMTGAFFLLVPQGINPDSNTWILMHADTMTNIDEYGLDDGETVEMLAEYIRDAIPGAEVSPPTVHGRMDISPKATQ